MKVLQIFNEIYNLIKKKSYKVNNKNINQIVKYKIVNIIVITIILMNNLKNKSILIIFKIITVKITI